MSPRTRADAGVAPVFSSGEPRLERLEGHDGAVAVGQDLAVEDPVPGEAASPLDDLGELAADVVQIS